MEEPHHVPATGLPPPHRGATARLALGCALVVLVVISFAALSWQQKQKKLADETGVRAAIAAEGSPVICATAKRAEGGRTVTLPGDVRALQQTTLYAKVSGYLTKINVDKGDHVAAGQTLGIVQSPETDQQARAAEADLLLKQQTRGRVTALIGKGVVSAQEVDKAEADVRAAQAEVERQRSLKGYEVVKAPFAGTITARYVDLGALVPAATGATQSAQPLFDLADMRTVRIYIYLAQSDAPYLRLGTPAKITSARDEHIEVTAPVTRISHAIDPRTRTMLAEIDVDNSSGHFFPGLFVLVTVRIDTPAGLFVPADAIIVRRGKTFVARIVDQHAHITPVEVADDNGRTVRILSGLTEGDLVGLHIGDEISDGALVRAVMQKE